MFGDISGGHFNPAVSLAVYIKERSAQSQKRNPDFGFMVLIWLSQIIGCCVGVLLVAACQQMDKDLDGPTPGIAFLCPPMMIMAGKNEDGTWNCGPGSTARMFNMLLAEIMGTFTLCGVILSIKYGDYDAPGTLKAFTVGLTLTCAIFMIGGISGGSINPAVGLV